MNGPATHRARLEPALVRLRRRIRRIQWLRGASRTAVVLLAGLLALAAIDRWSTPPPAARWVLPAVWLACGVAAAWRWLVGPLTRRLDPVRLARWLETRHPHLDERASTVLELADGHGSSGASPELLDGLALAAASDLDAIDPRAEVAGTAARRWLRLAALLALVWAALFAAWPALTARHVVRALVPTSSLGTAGGRIEVTPGDLEVIAGDPVEIRARVHGHLPAAPMEILVMPDQGTALAEPMAAEGDAHVFRLGRADRSFFYQVRAGRATADRHRVTVRPVPRLLDPRARLEFPAYTGWAPREVGLDGAAATLRALAGTRAELRASLNTSVASARLEVAGAPAGQPRLERGADGGTLAIAWPLDHPGTADARVLLHHPLGRDFEALAFTVQTAADEPPAVRWLAPTQDEMRLRPDDVLAFAYEVGDDVGLAATAIEVEAEAAGQGRLPLDLPPRHGKDDPPLWRGEGELPVGTLCDRWPQATTFRLRVRAEDGRPATLGGPGTGASSWKTIRLDRNAEPLARQELLAQHSDARQALEQARRDVEQGRQRLEQQRDQLRREEVPEPVRAELAKAREQLAQARNALADLAERMEEGVHAALADEVERGAEQVAEALEHAEQIPLADAPETRDQQLQSAQQAARDAEHQLEQLRDQLAREEARVHDLARLRDLQQQQRELARQANTAAATAPPAAPEPAWQQRQDQLAEALRQESQQRPDARAAALANQAEEARSLARRATEQANAQQQLASAATPQPETAQPPNQPTAQQAAQQAAPQANTPPSPRDALRDALAREQAALAAETDAQLADARLHHDPAANTLPEAATAATQAADALQQDHPKAAATQAATAAETLAQTAAEAQQTAANAQPAATENQPAATENQQAAAENQPAAAEAQQAAADNQQGTAEAQQAAAENQQGTAEAQQAAAENQQAAADNQQGTAENQQGTAEAQQAAAESQQAAAENQQRTAEAQQAAGEAQQATGAQPAPSAPSDSSDSASPSSPPSPAAAARQAAKAGQLADMAARQQQLAEAIEDFARQADAEAHAALGTLAAGEAGDLARDVAAQPQVNGRTGLMQEAAQASESGARQAGEAAESAASGDLQQAAPRHDAAAADLHRAAGALDRAAAEFAGQAAEAGAQPADPNRAPATPDALAKAFREAARAGDAPSRPQAAAHAQTAADALAQAARDALHAIQGRGPSTPGQPPAPAAQPATDPQEGPRSPTADPGVPPALAKLGLGADDWARIKSSLSAESGSAAAIQLPEEYRTLVRQYFEQMAKEGNHE